MMQEPQGKGGLWFGMSVVSGVSAVVGFRTGQSNPVVYF